MINRIIFIFFIGILTASCLAASKTAVDPIAGYHDELGLYVADGRVDYTAWSKDRDGLDRFIGSLEKADLSVLSENDKKALLINAYNACMVWMVLKHYPIESVFDIQPKPFQQDVFNLGGRIVSLDFIEHDLLRKMGDPRIHFAIVCASIGCPDLIPEVYEAERLDEQLDAGAHRYLSQKKGLRVKSDPPRVRLSMLFDWFGGDFGQNKAEILQFVALYAPDKWEKRLTKKAKKIIVKYIEYDWALNGLRKK